MRTFTRLVCGVLLLTAGADAKAQYCLLPGRTPYATQQPGITNFKLNTINRTSGSLEGGMSVPSLVVTTDSTILNRGQTYTVTIVHSKDPVNFPTARNNMRVWIDYNNNMSFDDAGETVLSSDFQTPGTYTGTFTVPLTAPIGTVRLRVTAKMSSDAGHTNPTPCDMPADPLGYHGEIEDYKVKIFNATGIANTAANALQVSVYPNPSNGLVHVSLPAVTDNGVSVVLYDVTGKSLGILVDEQKQTADNYTIDISNYNAGIYYMEVRQGEERSYQKVIKAAL